MEEPTIKNIGNSVATYLDTKEPIRVQVGHLNKGWRALILANRGINTARGMPRVSELSGKLSRLRNLHYANSGSMSLAEKLDFIDTQDGIAWTNKRRRDSYLHTLDSKRRQVKAMPEERKQQLSEDKSSFTPTKKASTYWEKKEQYRASQTISLVNLQVSPYISLEFQNRPNEISVNPGANWVSVKSMGRNEPFLMYTGGESSIQLELSWFANDEQNYWEVVNKCRLLESWTKADGYTKAPPVLMLVWGTSDLFNGQSFVLTSAAYKLSNFQAYARSSGGEPVDRGLLPSCATQTLILKRATTNNTTYEEYIPESQLEYTNGINFS